MPAVRASFNGNIFIGAFIFTNDKFTLVPRNTFQTLRYNT